MTADQMPELKECPFCGGDARLEAEQVGQDAASYVYCLRCDIDGETWRSDNWDFSKKKAIEAWNTRATPPKSQGVEVLVKLIDDIQDWIGSEIFDEDQRDLHDTTQEERAENISDAIREALRAFRSKE